MTICFVGSSFCLPEKRPTDNRHHPRKNNLKLKDQPKPFPIRIALIHRLKTRMIPFKNAKKKIQNFAEKVMQIVTLFIMPLSYIAFKELDLQTIKMVKFVTNITSLSLIFFISNLVTNI